MLPTGGAKAPQEHCASTTLRTHDGGRSFSDYTWTCYSAAARTTWSDPQRRQELIGMCSREGSAIVAGYTLGSEDQVVMLVSLFIEPGASSLRDLGACGQRCSGGVGQLAEHLSMGRQALSHVDAGDQSVHPECGGRAEAGRGS
jgi:hypothetical protein